MTAKYAVLCDNAIQYASETVVCVCVRVRVCV